MYPSEMPYFNTENPVVRDELWDDGYNDEEEELFDIDWTIDARKFSDEEVEEFANRIEEISGYSVNVEVFFEDDGSIDYFKIYGSCNEEIYDEIEGYLEEHNLQTVLRHKKIRLIADVFSVRLYIKKCVA